MVAIEQDMKKAAVTHTKLRPHRAAICQNLSSMYFNTGYECLQAGQLREAVPHIFRSAQLAPRPRQLKLLAALIAAAYAAILSNA